MLHEGQGSRAPSLPEDAHSFLNSSAAGRVIDATPACARYEPKAAPVWAHLSFKPFGTGASRHRPAPQEDARAEDAGCPRSYCGSRMATQDYSRYAVLGVSGGGGALSITAPEGRRGSIFCTVSIFCW